MIKAIFGILLGAIFAFVWMNISWMGLPFHERTLNKLGNEAEVAAAIKSGADKSGVYILPMGEAGDTNMEAKQKGPSMFAVIRPGANPDLSMGKMILRAFLTHLVCALIIGIMLGAAAPRLNYVGRVMFVVLGGLFAGLAAAYPNCIWWEFPASFVGLTIVDLVVGWGLAGLVMAGLINGKS